MEFPWVHPSMHKLYYWSLNVDSPGLPMCLIGILHDHVGVVIIVPETICKKLRPMGIPLNTALSNCRIHFFSSSPPPFRHLPYLNLGCEYWGRCVVPAGGSNVNVLLLLLHRKQAQEKERVRHRQLMS